jgi:hypothetical protein
MTTIIKSYREFDPSVCTCCGSQIPLPDRFFIVSDAFQAPLCRSCWWNGKPIKNKVKGKRGIG